jgi:hypothetical protein
MHVQTLNWIRLSPSCCGFIVRVSAIFLLSCRALGMELHVAPDGRDDQSGSSDKPLATFEAARDAIRKLRQQNVAPTEGVTVWVHGGTYHRDRAFELSAIDSGAAGAPVVYRALPGEQVRMMGGKVLRGFEPVKDRGVLARLNEKARSQVLQCDLRKQGVTDWGSFRSRGFGRATVPAHLELFFDRQPMTVARWPNEGEWAHIDGFPKGSGEADEHGGSIGRLAAGFLYSGDRPRSWQSMEDVWIHGYWAWDWANSYEKVDSLSHEQRLIKTAAPHGLYGFRKGQRFFFLNILEELDQPGEWYLDRAAGRLYFWPPRPIESGESLVSLLEEPLIRITDGSEIVIRGLTLEGTRGNAVVIRGGRNNRIAGCAIRCVGNYGVVIEGGHGHGVVSCDIENTGDGGVQLSGGDRQTLSPGGHFVENCHFQKQGRWSKCYVPAVLISGVGQRVAHNLIHDHPHCAILFGGNEHRIEFNEIHHIALETGDVGAIYTGRDWTFRGNVIRHNFIHDIGGVGMGSMGAYMDDCVSGTEIYGNVFYKVSRAAFLGGGRDHRVENNIFVDCRPAVAVDGRGLDKSPVWHDMVYKFMKTQLSAVPGELYRQRYPEIAALDGYYAAGQGVPPEGNRVLNNICVGGQWLSVGWHADSKLVDVRDNHVGADPGFVAPEKMDFRLKPDSPIWRTGFKAIPMEQIGLQADEYRKEMEARRSAAR